MKLLRGIDGDQRRQVLEILNSEESSESGAEEKEEGRALRSDSEEVGEGPCARPANESNSACLSLI
jgi:hypothetical protein